MIALYLESFGNPRKFARIARRVGVDKPIVALTAGRTSSGARGAQSHTAAAATPDVVVTALLEGAGVIKVDHLDELLDVSARAARRQAAAGERVALVGNSGGPLILAADASEECGLTVPRIHPTTRAALEEVAGTAAAVANPVDLTADGERCRTRAGARNPRSEWRGRRDHRRRHRSPCALVADARAAVARFAESATKPVVACVLGGEEITLGR